MRLLIIGGTRFVGRHMAESAIEGGHDVTVFHRGKTGADDLPKATRILGDRDKDLTNLDGQSWDATIDACAYVPRQVRELANALGDRAGQMAFVSTVSVYAEPIPVGGNEDSPLATLADVTTEDVTDETYGGLKVECEKVAREAYGDSLLIVRPTYVVGPYDYTHRFTYWVERIAAGGTVLAPGPRDYGIQLIDARDQADWTIRMLESRHSGIFHTLSPSPPFSFADMLNAILDAVAPAGTTLEWVDSDFLIAHGVDGEMLPLWAGADDNDFGINCDPARAIAAGLTPRPLAQTIQDILADVRETPISQNGELTQERESELLSEWKPR